MISTNAFRHALTQAFVAATNSQCPATYAALARIQDTAWSATDAQPYPMIRVFSNTQEYPLFDARHWLGETCGYNNFDRMNADFKRVTGRTRSEWLTLCGWK